MPRQFRLPLTAPPRWDRESFASSPTNVQALESLDAWPAWPEGRLALVGPAGTGKTHLARDWAARTGAVVIEAASTNAKPLDLASLRGRPLLVEDADRRCEDGLVDDETLFHLINMAGVDGGSLLLTGRLAPVAWDAAVPDLRSRLNALAVARIEEPDDVVLEAVLRRGFEAAGIRPAADLYPYLMARLPRSAPAALAAVSALDEAASQQGREVNKALALAVLDFGDSEEDED
ncbi:chromosomal replication initiator DnaA [Caulobacter sp. BK020]|uniref:DnaA regulatory inactivator HdaA n=1 Tax=Caulobacter sp. BK020 TaxID=2512117 RepID=UPI0010500DDA|nr:chromosomal replication initiator DnaA [Caulobacter sp. BK020]TCS17538.1 regulatory inactivation of DnaA Hda protein [Caulobacter sp. BK020]